MDIETFEIFSFVRGVKERVPVDVPTIQTVRADRQPRDTDREIHRRADLWFEKRFGVRYRSQTLFVTSSHFVARNYSASERHIVRVLPLGPYRYCWSPRVYDMLSISRDTSKAIEDVLDGAGYIETDLAHAHKLGHEVMLHCERYIAIPVHMLEADAPKSNDRQQDQTNLIILPVGS